MKHSNLSRALSLVLALVMVFAMLPAAVFASDSVVCTQITSAGELTTGKYVLVVGTGHAPTVLDGSWVLTETVTAENGTITTPAANLVWDITVEGDTVKLTDSNGTTIAPKGGNSNGIKAADYAWTVTCENGLFRFWGQGEDTVVFASNANEDPNYGGFHRFRGYKTTTVSNNPDTYPCDFALYRLPDGAAVDPEPSEPVAPSEPAPSEPAGETAAYMTEAPANGDTVLIYNAANTAVLGSAYDGKRQAGVTAAAENGVIALTDEMAQLLVTVEDGIYTFTLDGQYLTSADTGNGLSFSEELTDCGKWTLEVQENGSYIIMNVGANYNGNYNQAMEYYKGFTTYGVKTTDIYMMDFYLVKAAEAPKQSGIVTELDEGDTVVIFHPATLMALSTEYAGYYNAGTPVALANGVLTGFSAADIWTVGVNDDGTYTFATAEGKKLSMGASFSSMPLDDVNTAWTLETAKTENCFYIMNTARGNYIEWYADKNNWSSYYNNSNEALFAQMFYLVGDDIAEPETVLPGEGEQVVIYNLAAQGVLAAGNDTQSIENAPATVENGIATPANGGVVFTVSRNGE